MSRVLDTSCGSGGFLLHVLDKIGRQADKNYPDEIKIKTRPAGANHYRYWHTFAEKQLFGIEINDQISRVAKRNMMIHDDGHTNVITFGGLFQIDHITTMTKNYVFKADSFPTFWLGD